MACLKCGKTVAPKEFKGLGLVIIPEERDPDIAPGGDVLPIRVLMCICGFMELRAAQPRVYIEGEAVDLPPPFDN